VKALFGRRWMAAARWGRGGEVGGADGEEIVLERDDVIILRTYVRK